MLGGGLAVGVSDGGVGGEFSDGERVDGVAGGVFAGQAGLVSCGVGIGESDGVGGGDLGVCIGGASSCDDAVGGFSGEFAGGVGRGGDDFADACSAGDSGEHLGVFHAVHIGFYSGVDCMDVASGSLGAGGLCEWVGDFWVWDVEWCGLGGDGVWGWGVGDGGCSAFFYGPDSGVGAG